jgi:hypothetical protein
VLLGSSTVTLEGVCSCLPFCLRSRVEAVARSKWAMTMSPRAAVMPTGAASGSMGEVGLGLVGT